MIPVNSPLLSALAPEAAETVITGSNLTYAFEAAGVTVPDADVSGDRISLVWSEAQKAYVRDLYAYISTVVDVRFTEVSGTAQANFAFVQVADFTDGTTGYFQQTSDVRGELVIPTEYIDLDDVTLIHEMGHGLGLGHPFDGAATLPGVRTAADPGTFSLNTELATRMSYTPGASAAHPELEILNEAVSFGALDIAQLQLMHGANTSTGRGDNTYGDNSGLITIWDNGGVDIIDYSAASESAVIDLRAASLEVEPGGGGHLSFIGREGSTLANGGYTIAFGVEVENAAGGSGDDQLTGNALDNMLSGNGGADVLDGQEGRDTARYAGAESSYTVSFSRQSITLTDRVSGRDGTDTLIAIEQLSFEDSTFDIGIRSGAADLSAAEFAAIAELYIAYFDRAPAAKGLLYWATRLEEGMSLPEIAASFFVQPETQRTYAQFLDDAGQLTDTEAFVNTVFDNVLGRAPNGPYWVNELDREGSGITPSNFILAVLNGARAETGGAADRAYLETKADIGVYFSAIKGLSDYDDTVAVMEIFDGSAASVTQAISEIDQIYTEALSATSGELLLPLVGVIDDPFAGV